MTRERQFPSRRKNADARAVSGIARGKDENRFRVVELVRNRLHVGRFEILGVEHDRQRIAGEATGGEHIKGDETPAHEVPHRPLPQNYAPTSYPMSDEELTGRHQFLLGLD